MNSLSLRLTVVVTTVIVLGCLVIVPVATAAGTPRVITRNPSVDGAVSGDDVYWTEFDGKRETVNHLNLESGATNVVFSTSNPNLVIENLMANGGRVAFGTATYNDRDIPSAVKVAAADGSGLKDLVTGKLKQGGECGSYVTPLAISNSGEVFTGTLIEEKLDSDCVYSAHSESRQIVGYSMSGSSRAVFTDSSQIAASDNPDDLDRSHFASAEVSGGNLLIVTRKIAHEIDLSTGVRVQFTPSITQAEFASGSVNEQGRVLLTETKRNSKKRRLRLANGKVKRKERTTFDSAVRIFDRKFDPTSGRRIAGARHTVSSVAFCGNHIVRQTTHVVYQTSESGSSSRFVFRSIPPASIDEIDANGTVISHVAPLSKRPIYGLDCDGSSQIVGRFGSKRERPTLSLIPF